MKNFTWLLTVASILVFLQACANHDIDDPNMHFNQSACKQHGGAQSILAITADSSKIWIVYHCKDSLLEYGTLNYDLTNYVQRGHSEFTGVHSLVNTSLGVIALGNGVDLILSDTIKQLRSTKSIISTDFHHDSLVTLDANGYIHIYDTNLSALDSIQTFIEVPRKIRFNTFQHSLIVLSETEPLSIFYLDTKQFDSYGLAVGTLTPGNSSSDFWTKDDSVYFIHNNWIFKSFGTNRIFGSDQIMDYIDVKNKSIRRFEPCDPHIIAYAQDSIYWYQDSAWYQLQFDLEGCQVEKAFCISGNQLYLPCTVNGVCAIKQVEFRTSLIP